MPKFAAGVVHFQEHVYPEKRDLFERLAKGQEPEALFIACSDSRVETAMITQTEPGELFICRNAGNIVPPHTSQTGGMTASIEFAMAVLKVPHVVICGHTKCGAMAGAMNLESVESLPHVGKWLGFAKAAKDIVDALGNELDEDERMAMLLEQNVLLQMQHLRTHPTVAVRLAQGDLSIHGWVYDIETGGVSAYDENAGKFVPVSERYGDEVASHAGRFAAS
ncbi:carbonic anhydrase [Qipengyuania atrilutea]|uniref:Carbonic anhydrase n=1 Tax=Qipengyuania atrilutea TaxID=2744473 RepID=A0A850GWP0_9SPHN|nr:carbonic anhydrase [Actirhodobacter atriluteus]NVD43984.1 carbonic anhydrase [Actirhodobacter atriluteus]